MKKSGNKNLKIIAACSVAIFSLLVLIGGAFSWFTVVMSKTISGPEFVVVNTGTCDLYDIKLYKFDYASHVIGSGESATTIIDYSTPESGRVNAYNFDKVRNQFGYLDGDTWHQVPMMNVYDPVELEIHHSTIRDLNCDAIYKFTIATQSFTDTTLDATVSRILDTVKEDDELFLSSCVDYDLYVASDIADTNPLLANKVYYPSYISTSSDLTAEEEVYYRISYLTSIKSSHAHIYGTGENEISIASKDVSFIYDSVTEQSYLDIYINVNYAPSQLESTISLIYVQTLKAICDFGFKFYFGVEND